MDGQDKLGLVGRAQRRCVLPRWGQHRDRDDQGHWIGRRLTPGALVALLADIEAGAYVVEDLAAGDYRRVRELVDRYADSDVGFVEAAVLAVVERLGEPKLATLDRRHFSVLRPRHIDSITLLPA